MPDNSTPAPLLEEHRQHLRRTSGLTDETIATASLFSVTEAKIARRLLNWSARGAAPPTPALAIPYPETDGYVRLRPDRPRIDRSRDRAVKYEAPKKTPPRIYVPRPICADQLGEPDRALVLVEGEKKTLAAAQAGFAAVGAPGVNTFHDVDAKRNSGVVRLHPDLLPFLAPGRPCVIAFDSDVDTNPQVARAAARLARMLADNGCSSRIAYLPQLANRAKTGLDDLYLARGCCGGAVREEITRYFRFADPSQAVQWMRDSWSTFDLATRETELRRAVWTAIVFLDRTGFREWCRELAGTLNVGFEDLRRHEQPMRAVAGWMDAPGYSIDRLGVWKLHDDDKARPITAAPINVTEVGRDEEGRCYTTLRWLHGDAERIETVQREVTAGPDILRLSGRGAPITQANRAQVQTFLQRQEQQHHRRLPRVSIFTVQGWSRNLSTFVLGRRTIGARGRPITEADGKFLDALAPRGSDSAYRRVALEVRNASPTAELGWAAGYAPPLLRLLQLRSCLCSIWGPSGRGKSAIQALGVSPWGRPEGIKITGDATVTAIEAYLSRCRDLIAWVDDTQLTRSRAMLDALAYQVGSGTGRARGTTAGGMRPLKNWLSIGFVSGETPCVSIEVAST